MFKSVTREGEVNSPPFLHSGTALVTLANDLHQEMDIGSVFLLVLWTSQQVSIPMTKVLFWIISLRWDLEALFYGGSGPS